MQKYLKLLILPLLMVFSVNAWGRDGIDSGTINLLKESFKQNQDNTVISGLSVAFATDMLANGATGTALTELTTFLGEPLESKNAELHEMLQNLPETLQISNSIWGNSFSVSYQSLLTDVLDVSVQPLPENTSVINDWIAMETQNKITKVLDVQTTSQSDLYLVNTIYFKDDWVTKFEKNGTYPETFHYLSGQDKKIPMMHNAVDIMYAENSKLQSVKLPYKNGGFLVIYLPKQDIDFTEFMSGLSTDDLNLDYSTEYVRIVLPKFKIDKKIDVKQLFQNLGINEIFSEESMDLSGISNNPNEVPHVTKIAQKAVIEVDEEGTTAAAATVVEMKLVSTAVRQITEFVADRPFLFWVTSGDFVGFYTGNDEE